MPDSVEIIVRRISLVTATISIATGVFFTGQAQWFGGIGFLIIAPCVIMAPHSVYKRHFRARLNARFVAELSSIILLSVLLAAIGGQVYHFIPYFDSVVHFLNGILITLALVVLFNSAWLRGTLTPFKAFLYGGVVPALSNEVFEALSDLVFGTHNWGDYFKPLVLDTTTDVLFEVLGSLIAVFILKKYFLEWYHSWLREPRGLAQDVGPEYIVSSGKHTRNNLERLE